MRPFIVALAVFSATIAQADLPFYCFGLAGNFPGYQLYHGKFNQVEAFSWYEYGPVRSLKGAGAACTAVKHEFDAAVVGQGLCLCEQLPDYSSVLNRWPGGGADFTQIEEFPRVEPAGAIPPTLWGTAMRICDAALIAAKVAGICRK